MSADSPTRIRDASEVLAGLRPARLGRSVVASGARWFISVSLMAFTWPIVIRGIGVRQFGLWALLTTPTSLATVFDLGVIPAVVALAGASLGHARTASDAGDVEASVRRSASLTVSGVVLALLLAIATLIVGLLLAPVVVGTVDLPAGLAATGLLLFQLSIVNLSATIVGDGLTAATEAVGRVDLTASGAGFLSSANCVLMIVAMLVEPSLRSLAVVVGVNAALTVACYAACASMAGVPRLLPWGKVGRDSVAEIAKVGVSMGGANAVGSMVGPTVKWIVQFTAGPLALAAFELAARVSSTLGGAVRSLLYPLTSHLASLGGDVHSETFDATVRKATHRTAALALPVMGSAIGCASAVYALWLGDALPAGAVGATMVLVTTTTAAVLAASAYAALLSAGKGGAVLGAQIATIAAAAAVTMLANGVQAGAVAAAIGYGSGSVAGAAVTMLALRRAQGQRAIQRPSPELIEGLAGMAILAGVGLAATRMGAAPLLTLAVEAIAFWSLVAVLPHVRTHVRFVFTTLSRGPRRQASPEGSAR